MNSFTDIRKFFIDCIINGNIQGMKVAIERDPNLLASGFVFRKFFGDSAVDCLCDAELIASFYYTPCNCPFVFETRNYNKKELTHTYRVVNYLRSVGATCCAYGNNGERIWQEN